MDDRLWKVGELAKSTGLTVRTLHHFDEVGLLQPSERSEAGHRLYTATDVRRLHRVLALRHLGMPLSEIASTLDRDVDSVEVALRRRLGQVEQHMELQQRVRRQILAVLRAMEEGREPSIDQVIEAMEEMMKVTPLLRASLAVSLDGFIADKDGGVAWLNPYFTPEIDFAGFMETVGATVCGRRTFDIAVAQGHATGDGARAAVLTHRPLEDAPAGVEAFDDVGMLVGSLREDLAGTGKDIWLMGGGEAIAAFHAADLVDRWELGVIPVLLGEGIPLFPKHSRGLQGLRLTHSRTLKNGIVELWYEPDREKP